MLILTRKIGESIHIGTEIKVTIVNIDGGQVRVGIDAPREVIVHREEVYNRIMAENKAAQAGATVDLRKIAQNWKKMKGSSDK